MKVYCICIGVHIYTFLCLFGGDLKGNLCSNSFMAEILKSFMSAMCFRRKWSNSVSKYVVEKHKVH